MVTIVSVVPLEINEQKPGVFPKTYHIPAAVRGDFNILHIEDAFYSRSIGDGEYVTIPMKTDQLARSICDDYAFSHIGVDHESRPGIFFVPGKLNKDDIRKTYGHELKSAEQMQSNWFKRLVELADSDWARIQDPRIITNLQKTAAKYLRLEKEWNKETDLTLRRFCPACQSEVALKAVICKVCGCVIDAEAAKKMQFVKVG